MRHIRSQSEPTCRTFGKAVGVSHVKAIGFLETQIGDLEVRVGDKAALHLKSGGSGSEFARADHCEFTGQRAADEVIFIDADKVFVADVPIIDEQFDPIARLENNAAAKGAGVFWAEIDVANIFGKQRFTISCRIAITGAGRRFAIHPVRGQQHASTALRQRWSAETGRIVRPQGEPFQRLPARGNLGIEVAAKALEVIVTSGQLQIERIGHRHVKLSEERPRIAARIGAG